MRVASALSASVLPIERGTVLRAKSGREFSDGSIVMDARSVQELEQLGRSFDDQVRNLRMDRFRGETKLRSAKAWRWLDIGIGAVSGAAAVAVFLQPAVRQTFDAWVTPLLNQTQNVLPAASIVMLAGAGVAAVVALIILVKWYIGKAYDKADHGMRSSLRAREMAARTGACLEADDTDGPAPAYAASIAAALRRSSKPLTTVAAI